MEAMMKRILGLLVAFVGITEALKLTQAIWSLIEESSYSTRASRNGRDTSPRATMV